MGPWVALMVVAYILARIIGSTTRYEDPGPGHLRHVEGVKSIVIVLLLATSAISLIMVIANLLGW